ncbi:hypothetical protein DB88DRAFT_478811 [Papiliotrema laurentii]|uniref:Secreted protein n=1 Tax=Papiliotrema laurentii TaxID=5418 RepID=A0AAD9FWS1_PAPLA|nr:hypothetical protein DB88DRAFT_478811 [Papiliotrema laurentii]
MHICMLRAYLLIPACSTRPLQHVCMTHTYQRSLETAGQVQSDNHPLCTLRGMHGLALLLGHSGLLWLSRSRA